MDKQEILDEMVKYYVDDVSRRGQSLGSFTCEYITRGGNMCAVGRCLQPRFTKSHADFAKQAHKVGFCNGVVSTVEEELIDSGHGGLDYILQKKYKGHHWTFWGALQGLHDGDHNWHEGGLTSGGEQVIVCIERRIKEGTFTKQSWESQEREEY